MYSKQYEYILILRKLYIEEKISAEKLEELLEIELELLRNS
jgi:hypothetical protein